MQVVVLWQITGVQLLWGKREQNMEDWTGREAIVVSLSVQMQGI